MPIELEGVFFTRLAGVVLHGTAADTILYKEQLPDGVEDNFVDEDDEGSEDAAATEKQRWLMSLHLDKTFMDVTLDLDSTSSWAKISVSVTGHFHHAGNLRADRIGENAPRYLYREAAEFIRDHGYSALLPYIREASSDLARRLDVRTPRVPLNPPEANSVTLDPEK
jgi:hypothetical protein